MTKSTEYEYRRSPGFIIAGGLVACFGGLGLIQSAVSHTAQNNTAELVFGMFLILIALMLVVFGLFEKYSYEIRKDANEQDLFLARLIAEISVGKELRIDEAIKRR